MTVAVTVSTADAVPLVAPFKVSAVGGHDHATVTIAVTGTGPVYAYKLQRGGSAITNGVEVGTFGAVTGLAVTGVAYPAAVATPHTFTDDVSFAEFGGGADGAYTLNLYVYNGALFE